MRTLMALMLFVSASAAMAVEGAASPAQVGQVTYVAGNAYLESAGNKTPLREGSVIREGDKLVTEQTGHIHLKTVDQGFISLRPNSRAHLETYRYDPANPEITIIRLQLEGGVMRAISGRGAQSARQNFRVNTPVAAIGIKGTDFTVLAQNDLTRTIVSSGAIIVSGFGGSCLREAFGPCSGETVQLLAASQTGKLLEVQRGNRRPVVLDSSGILGPDQVAPPASTEPANRRSASNGVADEKTAVLIDRDARGLHHNLEKTVLTEVGQATLKAGQGTPPPNVPQVNWGRWSALAGIDTSREFSNWLAQNGALISLNASYFMTRSNQENLVMPQSGSFDFKLDKAEAMIRDSGAQVGMVANVTAGSLGVDFGKQTFTTRLDVTAEQQQYHLQAQGTVTADGMLHGNYPVIDRGTNTFVKGALAGQGATQAGYLFEYAINEGARTITGITTWNR